MLVSLQQTKDAVRLTEVTNRVSKLSTNADNRSRGASVSEGGIAKGFAPSAKPRLPTTNRQLLLVSHLGHYAAADRADVAN